MGEKPTTWRDHQINVPAVNAFFRTFPVKLSFKNNVTLDT